MACFLGVRSTKTTGEYTGQVHQYITAACTLLLPAPLYLQLPPLSPPLRSRSPPPLLTSTYRGRQHLIPFPRSVAFFPAALLLYIYAVPSIYLCRVTVLEKNSEEQIGGRLNELVMEGGFRFDTGPSLLLLPDTYRETFRGQRGLLSSILSVGGVRLRACRIGFSFRVFVFSSSFFFVCFFLLGNGFERSTRKLL